MKIKPMLLLAICLVLISLILAACSSSSKSGFPTGKFLDAENDRAGFQFNEDGTWLSFSGEYTLARGTYSVEGDLYIEETNNGGCAGPMNFKYSFDGTTLKFELTDQSLNDTCEGRRQAFNGKTYLLSQ